MTSTPRPFHMGVPPGPKSDLISRTLIGVNQNTDVDEGIGPAVLRSDISQSLYQFNFTLEPLL